MILGIPFWSMFSMKSRLLLRRLFEEANEGCQDMCFERNICSWNALISRDSSGGFGQNGVRRDVSASHRNGVSQLPIGSWYIITPHAS